MSSDYIPLTGNTILCFISHSSYPLSLLSFVIKRLLTSKIYARNLLFYIPSACMLGRIFLEFKIPSGAMQPFRKLAWFRGTHCRPTFLKEYGLVTKRVSQYALQLHDCRGRPYWKTEYRTTMISRLRLASRIGKYLF